MQIPDNKTDCLIIIYDCRVIMMNYTYIVKCADGTLYTGWTNCLQKRMKAHNEGKNGAKYTRTKRPVTLVYYEGFQQRRSDET